MMLNKWTLTKNNLVLSVGILAMSAISPTLAQAKDIGTMPYLSLELAQKITMAAWQQCKNDGYAVSVAVVDRSGVLLSYARDPMAGPHTVNSSQGKAFTSASMGQPTAGLATMIAEKPFLEGLRDMDKRMVILGGGLPIVIDGQRVGGIGVGGAPGGHLDEACATQGLKQIGMTKSGISK